MTWDVIHGDCLDVLATLPDESVQCCVTSPPYYGLRDYGVDQQLGLESTPDEYVSKMVSVFREVRRVLKSDGVCFINIGDSYWGGKGANGTSKALGSAKERGYVQPRGTVVAAMRAQDRRHDVIKPKDLIGIPWRLAFALQAAGWWLRQDIIWHKPNPMPESVQDRCTKAHEYVFLLSKSDRYFYDNEAVSEPATGGAPGNRSHRLADLAAQGDEKHRTKTGLVNYAQKVRKRPNGLPVHCGAIGYDSTCGGNGITRNRRSVWTIPTKPFSEAHFAVMPPDLARLCILAGSRAGDMVLDPFTGAGTTGMVALREGRGFVGAELNPDYCEIARKRIAAAAAQGNLFHEVTA